MKRVLLLVFIAIVTFLLMMLYKNPEILGDIWIWLIGLIGVIIKGGRLIVDFIKNLFTSTKSEDDEKGEDESEMNKQTVSSMRPDVTLEVLRYMDDGDTSVGLLYLEKAFYCYTLEDTHREQKIAGQTRIPAGQYLIQFRKEETELTKKYRERYPEWFTYHLELQNVKDFTSIYIHSGGDHTHTEGCILVSDSLSMSNQSTFLTNSRNTYRNLYRYLSDQLEANKRVVIEIKNESWFKDLAS